METISELRQERHHPKAQPNRRCLQSSPRRQRREDAAPDGTRNGPASPTKKPRPTALPLPRASQTAQGVSRRAVRQARVADLLSSRPEASQILSHLLAGHRRYGLPLAFVGASVSIPGINFSSKPKFGTVLLKRLNSSCESLFNSSSVIFLEMPRQAEFVEHMLKVDAMTTGDHRRKHALAFSSAASKASFASLSCSATAALLNLFSFI